MRIWVHKIQSSSNQRLEAEDDIAREVVEFFRNLYSASYCDPHNEDILKYVPSLIFSYVNLVLDKLPSLDEVKEVVFSLDKNSALWAE